MFRLMISLFSFSVLFCFCSPPASDFLCFHFCCSLLSRNGSIDVCHFSKNEHRNNDCCDSNVLVTVDSTKTKDARHHIQICNRLLSFFCQYFYRCLQLFPFSTCLLAFSFLLFWMCIFFDFLPSSHMISFLYFI